MSVEVIAFVNHYARIGYSRHIQTVCNEGLKKRGGNDSTLVFWRALGMLKEGYTNEAIREYESVAARKDSQLSLPVKLALFHAHQQSKVIDSEEVNRLRDEVDLEDANAPDRARLTAALVLWHLGEGPSAKKQVSRVLQLQPSSVPALTLLGWLELQEAEMEEDVDDIAHRLSKAEQYFNRALDEGGAKKDLEALMGKAKLHQVKEQPKEALDALSQVIVGYTWFVPALVEKFQVLMSMGDWEQAVETAERVRAQDMQNIEALRLMVLYQLTQESRAASAVSKLNELLDAMNKLEPQNPALCYKVAKPFARLAGRHAGILQLTLKLMDSTLAASASTLRRACKLAPSKGDFAAEYGYQQLLIGDLHGSSNTLKRASGLEEGGQDVMHYQIKALILLGQLEEAEQQLEFVSAIQDSLDRTPELALCSALLAQRQGRAEAQGLSLLDQALELHMRSVRKLPFDQEYFAKLNPDMLLEIAREYLNQVSQEPEVLDPSSQTAIVLNKATKLLQIVTKQVPGLLEGQMLLARARFVSCDFEGALRFCTNCTKADPTFAAASLLQAQIYLRQEREQQAHAVLEQAVSHNFAVRESPLFHFVKAKLLQSQGELQEASKLLQAAMKLPGVASDKMGSRAAQPRDAELSEKDRCSIYLLLVEVYLALNQTKDAKALMQQAILNFSEGPYHGLITIASAQVEVKKGNIENAIKMLEQVTPDNPDFYSARKQLAELYLTYRNDRHMYVQCHKELVKANPTVHSFMMLGEAYMKISEPQLAIAAFERALRINPGDSMLASRIGKVLVATHEYAKAIEYYSTAVQKDAAQTLLRYELAELYLELKKYEQAAKEVAPLLLEDGFNERDVREVIDHVKALRLLARVHIKQSQITAALDSLTAAHRTQSGLLSRVRSEAPDQVTEQRETSAQLAFDLAVLSERQHDNEQAHTYYQEALKHSEGHEKSRLALARLHLHRGQLDEAQAACVTLMRIDPENQEVSMILADLMLQKNEWDAAIYHFQQLLEKTPSHFRGLAKLLQLLRRAGKLSDAPKFIRQAERSSPRAPLEPGLRYCKGLLSWYHNDPRAALKTLNMARRDAEWGELAVLQMVQIYLNPENETNWDELELDQSREAPGDLVLAAEKLLRELPSSPRQQVLACYTLMSYKTSAHLEKAVSTLLELLNNEREYVPALVCLSQAYLMLKQAPKARNHLKRVAKMQFIAEMADDFERGWLILADVYIVSGKYDLAEELCRRCLASNKSCAKAWEFMGVVKEKEMSYKDAASHYENAWKFESEASAAVGYKLSFNYLKAKKYVDAIDVCHKVLQRYPDYPRIKKDVLEKAWQALRP